MDGGEALHFNVNGVDYSATLERMEIGDLSWTVWRITCGSKEVAQIPAGRNDDAVSVRADLETWFRENAFSCEGGPLDGGRVCDRGECFNSITDITGQTVWFSGLYRRYHQKYVWVDAQPGP